MSESKAAQPTIVSTSAPPVPSLFMLALYGTAYGLAGPVIARFLVNGYAIGALSVMLAALGLVRVIESLFNRHRVRCWDPDDSPEEASTELVVQLAAVMAGITIAFAIFAGRLPDLILRDFFAFQFDSVFVSRVDLIRNFSVQFANATRSGVIILGFCFILAAIYMEAGVALAITWIGSLWGIGLVSLIRDGAFSPVVLVALLISLGANSIGFATSGTTGLFISRGLLKYGAFTTPMKRIWRTSLMLFGGSFGFVLFAAAIHAWVAAKG